MRSGCSFPLLLILFLGVILSRCGGGESEVRRPPIADERSADGEEIIPMPGNLAPSYAVEDPGAPQDSQGTAFAVSTSGLWMTAEHVVNGCDRLGLANGPYTAERVREVYESAVSDAALIADGTESGAALALARSEPEEGETGYHMGFPTGRPAVVESVFLGRANAVRRSGAGTAILAWSEVRRIPEFNHTLGGISGGPTLDSRGRVVGVNSASSARRGRVLTTHPAQPLNLLRAAGQTPAPTASVPIRGPGEAAQRFEQLYAAGALRHVYCDVSG